MRTTLQIIVIVFVATGLSATALADEPKSAEALLADAQDGPESVAPESVEPDAGLASAGSDGEATAAEPNEEPNPYGAASVLFFGAGLVALGAWGFQRFRQIRGEIPQSTMQHVQSMKLGPKHQVTVIDVDGRRFLVGMADGAIALLSELDVAAPATTREVPTTDGEEGPAESWTAVFSEARQKFQKGDGTDGRIINFDDFDDTTPKARGADAYRRAGRGSAPRQRETDSVVVALKRLEESGDPR